MSNNQNSTTPVTSTGVIKTVARADIDTSKTRTRALMNEDAVERYREAYEAGVKMPPLVVFTKTGGPPYLLSDGWHCYEAQSGKAAVEVEVRDGGTWEAIEYAASTGLDSGLPRTRDDRGLVADMMLRDEERKEWSNGKIGKLCGLTDEAVRKRRLKLETAGEIERNDKTIGVDGKERDKPKASTSNRLEVGLPRQPGLSLVGGPNELESMLRSEIVTLAERVKTLEQSTKPVLRLLALLEVDTVDEAIEAVRDLLGEEISAAA